MKLPLPTYGRFTNLYSIAEAIAVFVNQIDTAIKTLTSKDSGIRFHSENHMVQMIMYTAGLPMCEESFKDVETYLGENLSVLMRDFGSA
jgi:hypothetical protein